MISCLDCDLYRAEARGRARWTCNPYTNIKEPECLQKWALIALDNQTAGLSETIAQQAAMLTELAGIRKAYEATLDHYNKLAPLQEKMMKHMEREIDEAEDADSWKRSLEDDEEDDENQP